ncbi:MAG: hypothetical protein ACXVB9_00500 [Bdellovibrionota bacterium]
MILLFLLQATVAFAGGSTGGGNTVNHQLVEDYAVDDTKTDLPDFGELEQYLKVFDERIPGCGTELRKIAYPDPEDTHGVIWYLIPAEIATLPSNVTGFTFSTEQPAAQSKQEIFVAGSELDQQSKHTHGELYLHEVLMMDHPDKDGESVRRLMIYLKQKKYAPSEQGLQNMLSQLGFSCGKQPTKTQIADTKAAEEKRQQLAKRQMDLANSLTIAKDNQIRDAFLTDVRDICAKKSPAESRLKELQARVDMSAYFYSLSEDDQKKISEIQPGTSSWSSITDVEANNVDKIISNDHFASMLAAMGLVDTETTSVTGKVHVNKLENDMLNEAMYANADSAGGKKLAQYGSKYQDYTSAQRVSRACDDISALSSRDAADPGNPQSSGSDPAR